MFGPTLLDKLPDRFSSLLMIGNKIGGNFRTSALELLVVLPEFSVSCEVVLTSFLSGSKGTLGGILIKDFDF